MGRYGYRIEHNYGNDNQESWDLYLDGTGVEDYDGTIDEYAQLILDNQVMELKDDEGHGQWRVLAWNSEFNAHGENRLDIADPDDADAIAEIDLDDNREARTAREKEQDLKTIREHNRRVGGRPAVGNTISVAMGQTLPRVDAYAKFHRLSRAEAIRRLVDIGLAPIEPLVWSLVRGESPTSHAVEPGVAGIDVPEAIVDWAIQHGLDPDDPDMYLLVAPEDEAGEVNGELAFTILPASKGDADLVREMLEAQRYGAHP